MSIVHEHGDKVDMAPRQHVVDLVLEHPEIIGRRRWGMIQLYYRAGLSQQEIGEIFGLNRQMVTYEMRRAFRLLAVELAAKDEAWRLRCRPDFGR